MRYHLLSSALTIGLGILAGCQAAPGTSATGEPELSASTIAADDSQLLASIDRLVEQQMEIERLPGVAVVIVKDGKTIFKKGYGYANFAEKIPVDPNETIFRIGSISKPLTALGIMRLVEQGRLSLDDDIAPYTTELGSIPNSSGSDEPIRIWNLLTHTSGFDQIGVNRFDPDFGKDIDVRIRERPSLKSYLSSNNLRRTVPPGSHYRYDTYGITLAGHILEQITGKTYGEAIRELVFEPAGMGNSYVGIDPRGRGQMAWGHGVVNDEIALAGYEVYFTQPASSIDATPADMGRLLEALTGGGVTSEGRRLFKQATLKDILSVQYRPHPDFPGMTHGFVDEGGYQADSGYFPREVGHSGMMFGFRSSLTIFPEENVGLFVTTNRNHETGGGWVRINGDLFKFVRSHFMDVPETAKFAIPEQSVGTPLAEYQGDYYYDVFMQHMHNARGRSGSMAARTASTHFCGS